MNQLKKIIIFSLITTGLYSQECETIINTDFTIRDFFVQNDSVFYIKKRNAYLQDLKTGAYKNYFLGGYGLELFFLPPSNSIISSSNELVDNVCSVRFYNKSKNEIENIFYYRNGKIIDFLVIPEIKTFVLSLTNNKIIFIDYRERPKFIKSLEIELDAKSRRLIFKNNMLYYINDKGEINQISLENYEKKLIYKCDNIITDFYINDAFIFYFTIDGQIVKLNRDNNKTTKLFIENNFIINSIDYKNNNMLICGSWNGTIYQIDVERFSIVKNIKYHKRSVLNIVNYKGDEFYSSGLDKTIKKWKLN